MFAEILKNYIDTCDGFIVSGICTQLAKVDRLFEIMKIDIVVIVSTEVDFINTSIQKVEERPVLLIGSEKIKNKIILQDKDQVLHFIAATQNLDELRHKIEALANRYENYARETKIYSQISKREMQILSLISKGKKNKEMAAELFLSVKTIENHRNNIIRKTKTKSMLTLINDLHKAGYFRN